jgi:hypothetical protein
MPDRVRHWKYSARVDLTGKNLIALSGAPRSDLEALFADLQPLSSMLEREATRAEITAYNGELADEIHEFENAVQGSLQLRRILLRAGAIVEIELGL